MGIVEDQAIADAKQNARVEKQLHQCRLCRYRLYDGPNNKTKGCDYVSHTGHLRDRGNGPGHCGSFAPLRKMSQAEKQTAKVDHARRALQISESNIGVRKLKIISGE